MIRNMAMEFTPGQMAENTQDNGKTVNNMEKENMCYRMGWKELDSGKMENAFLGKTMTVQLPDLTDLAIIIKFSSLLIKLIIHHCLHLRRKASSASSSLNL